MQVEDEDQDIFQLFGIDVTPPTAEEEIYSILTEPNRLGNLLYWVRHEMAVYYYINEEHVINSKLTSKPLGARQYAKLIITYFCQMHHLTRFQRLNPSDPDPAKLNIVVDMLIANEDVLTIIRKAM